MRRRMHRRWRAVSLTVALLGGLTACAVWPDTGVSSRKPDKVLFDRAMSAAERHHYDVANLTLQVLVNTYPDSKYAKRAERLVEDPRIAPCGVSGDMVFLTNSPSTCLADSTSTSNELEFLPPPDPE
jgi:hypothetical protein